MILRQFLQTDPVERYKKAFRIEAEPTSLCMTLADIPPAPRQAAQARAFNSSLAPAK
jgi:hypothetical protein